MRLSEAIRIGASWNKQATKRMKEKDGGTCALGAAYEGIFGTLDSNNGKDADVFDKLLEKFPFLSEIVCSPLKHHFSKRVPNFSMPLSSLIMNLNDYRNWTRDQIADWVEKLENEKGWTGTEDIKEAVCEVAHA